MPSCRTAPVCKPQPTRPAHKTANRMSSGWSRCSTSTRSIGCARSAPPHLGPEAALDGLLHTRVGRTDLVVLERAILRAVAQRKGQALAAGRHAATTEHVEQPHVFEESTGCVTDGLFELVVAGRLVDEERNVAGGRGEARRRRNGQ